MEVITLVVVVAAPAIFRRFQLKCAETVHRSLWWFRRCNGIAAGSPFPPRLPFLITLLLMIPILILILIILLSQSCPAIDVIRWRTTTQFFSSASPMMDRITTVSYTEDNRLHDLTGHVGKDYNIMMCCEKCS